MSESIVSIKGNFYRYSYNPDTGDMEYLGPAGDGAPAISEADFLAHFEGEHYEHYTDVEREAIMRTPGYLSWWEQKKEDLGYSGMSDKAILEDNRKYDEHWRFHAFMTDVGKYARNRAPGIWPETTRWSDNELVEPGTKDHRRMYQLIGEKAAERAKQEEEEKKKKKKED
jgi:hypothetical protein